MEKSNHTYKLDRRDPLDLYQFILEFADTISLGDNGRNQTVSSWRDYLQKDLSFILVWLLCIPQNEENLISELNDVKNNLEDYLKNNPSNEIAIRAYADLDDLVDQTANMSQINTEIILYQTKRYFTPYLEKSLSIQSDHAPDIGVLLGFISLFHTFLTSDLNALTDRLNDFYYKKILSETLADVPPQDIHVYFKPQRNAAPTLIPKGTMLDGGRDEWGNKVQFYTQDDVSISKAQIKEVRSLYFAQNRGNISKGIYSNQWKIDDSLESEYDIDLFGKNIAINRTPTEDEYAKFGFAFCSSTLNLKEGFREITISLSFKYLEEESTSLETYLKFSSKISLSTKDGFEIIPSRARVYPTQRDEDLKKISYFEAKVLEEKLELIITLAPSFPSISSNLKFSKKPMIKVEFHPSETARHLREIYHELREGYRMEGISLEVKCEGLKELVCYNDLGIIDTRKPFQPFGSSVSKDSNFTITNLEALQKPLTYLSLDLKWTLPEHLEDYFEGYDQKKTIEDYNEYQYKLRILNSNQKAVEKDDQQLFVGGFKSSSIRNEVDSSNFELGEWKEEIPSLEQFSDWGSFSISMSSPDFPFGHRAYQEAFRKELQRASENKTSPIPPNMPLAPSITDISLNYGARANDLEPFHIHPFGIEKIDINEDTRFITGKYEYDSEPYNGLLFIGVEGLLEGEHSLYFEIGGSTLMPSSSESDSHPMKFFILDNNDLVSLPVLFDQTEAFEKSGVIKVKISKRNTQSSSTSILDGKLSWIVICVQSNADNFGTVRGIFMNGVKSVQKVSERINIPLKDVPFPDKLRTLEKIPAIREIVSPFPPSSEKDNESSDILNYHTQSIIRNRRRPFNDKDLASYVSEYFQPIDICRVFSKTESVELVILPYKRYQNDRPFFPVSFLQKVKSFVQSLLSPHLEVKVENVRYAVLQLHSFVNAKATTYDDPEQLNFLLKRELVQHQLIPWKASQTPLGISPDFNKIKLSIEEKFRDVVFKEILGYYYYLEESNSAQEIERWYGKFVKFERSKDLNHNLLFVPDPQMAHHKILHTSDRWEEFKRTMANREAQLTPINGFDPGISFTYSHSLTGLIDD